MTTQGFFQQIGGQIAATAPFCEGMTLEVIHHPAGQVTLMRSEPAASATAAVLGAAAWPSIRCCNS